MDIFEPFVQSTRTKTAAGGTGVGLAICKEIIQGHGGKIWAENNEDGGSTFHILLLVMEDTEIVPEIYDKSTYDEKEKKGTQPSPTSNPRSLMVLAIDDEPDCLLSLELIFSRLPHCTLITAEGGIEGLRQCRQHAGKIDMVLLDLMMPDIHGLEVLKEVKADSALRHIPVILQSGTSDTEEIEKAKALGIAGFIAKPYKKEKIFEVIK